MNRALFAYNLLLHLGLLAAVPVLAPLSLLSAKRRATAGHRLALRPPPVRRRSGRPLWIHALSVGEMLSAVPLVEALGRRWPERPLFVSASTLTGRQIAERQLAGRVDALGYFPYDLPLSVHTRLRQVRPTAVILVETDLWPNFLAQTAARRTPVVLVNARLSARSFRGYRRLRFLAAPLLGRLAAVAVQSEPDAERFRRLGVADSRLHRTGNLKFDMAAETDPATARFLRHRLQAAPDDPVVVAGSTHRGDEGPLLEADLQWRRRFPRRLLVIAPRDVARAGEVLAAWRRRGTVGVRWSECDGTLRPRPPLVVVDRLGELRSLYGAADVAFVGGSLAGCGGHNPLEPAAWGRPVLFGPDMSDFARIAAEMISAGAAVPVADAGSLAREAARLLGAPATAAEKGAAARRVFGAHRGAVARTLAVIEEVVGGERGKRCSD